MAQICLSTEEYFDYETSYLTVKRAVKKKFGKEYSVSGTIASSAVKTADEVSAKLIITLTESGSTSRLVSKYKPSAKILAVTQHEQTARQLMVTRGVHPIIIGSMIGTESIIKKVIDDNVKKSFLESGNKVVICFGNVEGVKGQTNNMKTVIVE